MLAHDGENGVDRTLHVAAAGVRFDGGVQDLEGLAETVGEALRNRVARVAVQKTVAAFQDSERPRESFGRQQRRVNAVLRRQAGMDSLGPRAIGQKLHRSGGHAARDANGGEGLLRRQAEQFRRCDRRAENAAGGRHMKTERVMFLGLHRHRDTGGGFEPGDHSGEERIGRSLGHGFGQGERGGIHGCAQVNGPAAVRVVHFDGVRGRAVGHRCEAGNGADASADHGGASVGAHALDHSLHRGRRFFARAANRARQIVEQEIAGAIENLGGQVAGL